MITPERASAIAHGDMPFHNPVAEPAIEALLDLVALARATGCSTSAAGAASC